MKLPLKEPIVFFTVAGVFIGEVVSSDSETVVIRNLKQLIFYDDKGGYEVQSTFGDGKYYFRKDAIIGYKKIFTKWRKVATFISSDDEDVCRDFLKQIKKSQLKLITIEKEEGAS